MDYNTRICKLWTKISSYLSKKLCLVLLFFFWSLFAVYTRHLSTPPLPPSTFVDLHPLTYIQQYSLSLLCFSLRFSLFDLWHSDILLILSAAYCGYSWRRREVVNCNDMTDVSMWWNCHHVDVPSWKQTCGWCDIWIWHRWCADVAASGCSGDETNASIWMWRRNPSCLFYFSYLLVLNFFKN